MRDTRTDIKLMTEGSIPRHVLRYAFPIFVGYLFQQLYNTADALIVGNLVGSSALAARFEKLGFPYKIMRFEGEGHSVATRMNENLGDVLWFIDNMAVGKRNLRIDETFNDVAREPANWDHISAGKLYK